MISAHLTVQYAATETTELPTEPQLHTWVNTALTVAKPSAKTWELTVRIVDSVESQALNQQWRHQAKPTNVLSFPFENPPSIDLPLLGDIIICASVVNHEAHQQHKPQLAHWAHIVVHGTLHLLGYDHIEETQAQHMENLEISILARLGYPNPYQLIEVQ